MTAAKKTVKVGIIGAGRMAVRHIETLESLAKTTLVAVCTPLAHEQQWCAENVPDAKVYPDAMDMIKDPDVEAVFIVTPTTMHYEQFLACIANGKHVFCEKPLSINPEQCWEMYDAALKHPELVAVCAFPRRNEVLYNEARAKIVAGEIGEVVAIRSQIHDKFDPSPYFLVYCKTSGGIFVDSVVHCIDSALYLLGKDVTPKRVFASGNSKVIPELGEMGDVDNCFGNVEFTDGTVMTFTGSRTNQHGHHTCTEVIGSKGKIYINPSPRLLNLDVCDATGVHFDGAPDHFTIFRGAFTHEIAEFADQILNGKATSFNLKDAAKAVSIAYALQDSVRNGVTVEKFVLA
ncbi:uncharacterized protein V1510DRAFT_415377 [Dipodascopsis tothii]|uniref:uncharacterized protein n=1 Tax=Dipodascopsis tothii TaxID=44089 RepID=UPI0034CF6D57